MCPSTGESIPHEVPKRDDDEAPKEPFPWHVGVYDAHCHPTDTMASISSINNMQARLLTIMATRGQDQDLVASVAEQHGITDLNELRESSSSETPKKVVPAFGWHPWFSHQLYDDSKDEEEEEEGEEVTDVQAHNRKTKHYSTVLSPPPDADFIASLPDPIPLSKFLQETRQRLLAHPTALVGEIGLDKAFRLPWGKVNESSSSSRNDGDLTPGGREGRMLSPYHVKMAHQVDVLKAQLRLAGELGRPVSLHGVQAHGVLFDALASLWKGHEKEVVSRKKQKMIAKGVSEDFSSSSSDEEEESDYSEFGLVGEPKQLHKIMKPKKKPYKPKPKPFPPRACLHSFSGPPQVLKQYLDPKIPVKCYFSFSMVINLGTAGGEAKFADVIRACPDGQVLVESDLHVAGEDMDGYLEDIARRICEIKGWGLEEGMQRIRRNYEEFLFG
ncbi:Metallo-dependent hydrolase [Neurospora crassa]|uniref:Cut9 interacting protein Scn1 n=1 Tax=Neurospora crassa (strain ATCC 24698 / 74-OR23-1A / CBS 708.71 / DSM 1257 / FGSC 987) TaxID=367110 RepID=Q7S8M5_NEUCR|nr:Cut9 interacting protein Scn1 [Neurospora crassa OR74A]EAA32686.1 Cut9 interacting protein Scn1 [Neurospora crassa OR74A]KHE84932.1 Metallo-dependent hydrolase [Neurospora crassa]|eukprot:XP_961922.1 Cut9 interacting protein Scn1 [Neurospora crassa OR74A]